MASTPCPSGCHALLLRYGNIRHNWACGTHHRCRRRLGLDQRRIRDQQGRRWTNDDDRMTRAHKATSGALALELGKLRNKDDGRAVERKTTRRSKVAAGAAKARAALRPGRPATRLDDRDTLSSSCR
jgi:hypothetical protein